MWITYFNWFMAILSLAIWSGTYAVYEKHRLRMWFDNKFGKDDPMPPTPKQQNNLLSLGESSSIKFDKPTESEQS